MAGAERGQGRRRGAAKLDDLERHGRRHARKLQPQAVGSGANRERNLIARRLRAIARRGGRWRAERTQINHRTLALVVKAPVGAFTAVELAQPPAGAVVVDPAAVPGKDGQFTGGAHATDPALPVASRIEAVAQRLRLARHHLRELGAQRGVRVTLRSCERRAAHLVEARQPLGIGRPQQAHQRAIGMRRRNEACQAEHHQRHREQRDAHCVVETNRPVA